MTSQRSVEDKSMENSHMPRILPGSGSHKGNRDGRKARR